MGLLFGITLKGDNTFVIILFMEFLYYFYSCIENPSSTGGYNHRGLE